MRPLHICPVCRNAYDQRVEITTVGWGNLVNCQICGKYILIQESDEFLSKLNAVGSQMSQVERNHIAHKIKTASIEAGLIGKFPAITLEMLDGWRADGFSGPNPAQQVTNAIRYFGDLTAKTGERILETDVDFFVVIGSPTPEFAADLLLDMLEQKLIDGAKAPFGDDFYSVCNIKLTLAGWEIYERERRGLISGRYGFLAMKFGEESLEALVRDLMKPELKRRLGLELQDMRDAARAGIIDNIMRTKIRDSVFVVVDLTHDNAGAYWEAGYAEGLGKPVIYICEATKFEKAKTHFDTNHCTTVCWSNDNHAGFIEELVATLRNSLSLFQQISNYHPSSARQ